MNLVEVSDFQQQDSPVTMLHELYTECTCTEQRNEMKRPAAEVVFLSKLVKVEVEVEGGRCVGMCENGWP